MPILDISVISLAYLLGSISAAIIVCKLMQLPDPRTQGSGNPGATNVLRVGGKKAAAITLFADMLKGLVPVLAARHLELDTLTVALTGAAAFTGHLFPVFFGFKGGKGVATLLGVLFGFLWWVGLATALSWLIVAKVFKLSSLAALIATALAPVYLFYLVPNAKSLIITTIIMVIVLFWRHRSNIQKLLSGNEGSIGKPS
ncbi:Acyl-phosphate:glycerol-3-phosphate O-acyltransferase PlsY (EC 2.3.1.n3) [hydrothermal vent metagenome]|uniref:Acyl-phosphate:glycerol-3-phosphate O-acyltransferase PlsY n=1 Tax=hydrothermal vent metagenome TaxID=652676 RepID=A0A3B0ZYA0_9ZZZZ